MTMLRKVYDWLKYERLYHYPALEAFERPEALKRLKAYEREERKACALWLNTAHIMILGFGLLWIGMLSFGGSSRTTMANTIILPLQIPGWVIDYLIYRRVRRRVAAKVAAELGGGRLSRCVECDYDLRASEDRCPECGAPVRVQPPA